MEKEIHQSPLATAYAEALLELANESKSADSIGEELDDLKQLIADNDLFAQLLADPTIGVEERGQFLHRVFDGRASTLMLNFLGLVNEKGRLGILKSIAAAYHDLLDQQQGIVEIDVTVANQVSDSELDGIRRKVSDALKREAVVYQYVDPSIIGGLILRVKDQLIDGSVRAQLSAIRKTLLDAKPSLEQGI
jgi:F-type H+-transporting ATPase subunit delta